jgi:ATP dependent DNA ligase-like protein
MVAAVREQGLEGVVAKRKDSLYEPGKRTGSWVKLRINRGQEFVIGGFTPGVHGLDSIIVGYYRDNDLVYVARTRNGFVPATRRMVYEKLKPLVTDKCPFVNLPELLFQSVQLVLKSTEFRLFQTQLFFRLNQLCLGLLFLTRVGVEPLFYLYEHPFKFLLFRCSGLTMAPLLLDLFHSGRTISFFKLNLSEPRPSVIDALLHASNDGFLRLGTVNENLRSLRCHCGGLQIVAQ